MRDWAGKRYWLVGASEGLGRALALQMSRAGVELVLSARNEARLHDLASELPGKAEVVVADVADTASVRAAAEAVGPVDGVICMAGLYWPMTAQETDADRLEAMCDVNLTGTARVIGAVLPGMVERGHGHLVLMGSLAAIRGMPGMAGYAASKAGIVSLAECLYADLRGTGIDVQVVNPGYVRTRMTDKNDFEMPMILDAREAARRMFDHMGSDRLRTGFPGPLSVLVRLGQFLPDWAWYPLLPRR